MMNDDIIGIIVRVAGGLTHCRVGHMLCEEVLRAKLSSFSFSVCPSFRRVPAVFAIKGGCKDVSFVAATRFSHIDGPVCRRRTLTQREERPLKQSSRDHNKWCTKVRRWIWRIAHFRNKHMCTELQRRRPLLSGTYQSPASPSQGRQRATP